MVSPDSSVDDIIDSLDNLVEQRLSVNDGQVISDLAAIDLTPDQLKRILTICNGGFQMSLTERTRPDAYQAIIDYVRNRLSQCAS